MVKKTISRLKIPPTIVKCTQIGFTRKNSLAMDFEPIYNAVMQKRSSRKNVDLNQIAKYIVDDATSEGLLKKAAQEGKNPAAVYLGRLGGLKGGKARAAKLSAGKRKEIATNAANKRWENKR